MGWRAFEFVHICFRLRSHQSIGFFLLRCSSAGATKKYNFRSCAPSMHFTPLYTSRFDWQLNIYPIITLRLSLIFRKGFFRFFFVTLLSRGMDFIVIFNVIIIFIIIINVRIFIIIINVFIIYFKNSSIVTNVVLKIITHMLVRNFNDRRIFLSPCTNSFFPPSSHLLPSFFALITRSLHSSTIINLQIISHPSHALSYSYSM